jgi:inward rectifier potassium channel
MQKATFDPGLTQQYTGALKRVINTDGQFNVRRTGRTWRDVHPYLFLINANWTLFSAIVMAVFVVVNIIFASIYMAIGIDHIKGTEAPTDALRFLNAFFFSAHTLTTVGYGNMWPNGPAANTVAAIEALVGLMAFAIATGLLFGRFSKPSARIGFSNNMIVAPYQDKTGLQFRIVNRRSNNLINLEARVMLMTVEDADHQLKRKFTTLELERSTVYFLALTWTIVHPIEETSPLYGKTAADLKRLQAELLVMVSGFDDTFGQTVHARYSYRYDEITWSARFAPAFEVDKSGELVVEVNKVSAIERVPAPAAKALEGSNLP